VSPIVSAPTHGLTLRTTLVLLMLAATAYVAVVGVYITWRLVPVSAGQEPYNRALLENAAADVVRAVRWWLLIAAALVPLLALFVYRRLYRPLARLDEGLARVAAGDLTTPISVEHDDELGRLGDEFNEMTNVLRQRAEEERRRARRQTERLEEQLFERERLAILGRMAGAIAHEVGAPLNSVLGHTQLLAQEQLTERGRRRLTVIESQVQRMVQIIHDYLARTRGAPAERKALDVNELVHDALAQLDVALLRARVQTHADTDPSAPVVIADQEALLRVLVNLIQNAIDAMPSGGDLSIRTAHVEPPDNSFAAAAIEVIDSGAGIPLEAQAKIFDLFFTTKPQGRGTGMGLSICQEIVKMHGGRIEVTSEVGTGTRMRVLLPLPAAAELMAAQATPTDLTHTTTTPSESSADGHRIGNPDERLPVAHTDVPSRLEL
jgi:two-component system NtrC family sensor kinase